MNKRFDILLVEDSPNIRLLVRRLLENEDHAVWEADSARAALEMVASIDPDVILLDLGLPDCDGLELIPLIRAQTSAPLIVLSARDSSDYKVSALDLGADDYVTKPFDIDEFQARVRTALRRKISSQGAKSSISVADVEIDLVNRRIVKGGKVIRLTPKEYSVVAELAKYQGRVITHEQLLKSVWGNEFQRNIEYLRIIIKAVRKKIETDCSHPSIIINERGIGYRLPGVGK
jgi:two-component system KDP operon response regulator KdpE